MRIKWYEIFKVLYIALKKWLLILLWPLIFLLLLLLSQSIKYGTKVNDPPVTWVDGWSCKYWEIFYLKLELDSDPGIWVTYVLRERGVSIVQAENKRSKLGNIPVVKGAQVFTSWVSGWLIQEKTVLTIECWQTPYSPPPGLSTAQPPLQKTEKENKSRCQCWKLDALRFWR